MPHYVGLFQNVCSKATFRCADVIKCYSYEHLLQFLLNLYFHTTHLI